MAVMAVMAVITTQREKRQAKAKAKGRGTRFRLLARGGAFPMSYADLAAAYPLRVIPRKLSPRR